MVGLGADRPSRYQAWISARPWTIVAVAAALTAAAVALAFRLELRTNISELLPSDDPGVVALQRTHQRIGDLSLLLIGVHSPDPDANLRYAEALTQKLRELPPSVCALATYHVRDVLEFFERNRWLYLSEADLETIRDRVRKEITRKKNPLLIDLGGDDESVDELRARLGRRRGLGERFPGGVFTDDGGHYVWIAALPPGGLFVERAGEGLWQAAHRLLEAHPPQAFHAGMRVRFAGPVTTAIASREAVERDIVWVTVICLVVVAVSIGLYFKRLRAVPLIGLPAVMGTVMAFAVADLAFGYLNSSTAFLGSIILGNGINYAIVLMSRYEEQRSAGDPAGRALARTLAGTWRGTAVAAVSASAAYASLTVTSFRGFYQFGVMGAVGSLACWVATFTLLPAMLVLLDRGKADGARGPAPLRLRYLGAVLERRAGLLLAGSIVLSLLAGRGLSHFVRDPFEYDFRKLNAKLYTSAEARRFETHHEKLFGRWPSPTIILADDIGEVEAIRAAIRRQDAAMPGKDVIGQVVTIYDFLPGPPDVQRRKLDLIAQIRKLTRDPALEVLTDEERKDLNAVDPPDDLRPLAPLDLPPIARRAFTEVDGTVGRVVLVYAREDGLSVWNGRDLLRIAAVLQQIRIEPEAPGGLSKTLETSGSAVVFGAMIRSILHDGPIATAASLLAILIIIAFAMRPALSAVMTLGTLVLGVLWMVGGAGLAGVHVTFLNFIALPITFGIGAEYALNVIARYQEEKQILSAVISTGGAVALCSWTTIVGYGSLLAARNQALQGFGAMAILGEVACLAAAIVALPALIVWRRTRKGRRR